MQGATQKQMENSLKVLGELNQMLSVLNMFATESFQQELTYNVQEILVGLSQSVKQSIRSVNSEIIIHNECLDDLLEIIDLFGEEDTS